MKPIHGRWLLGLYEHLINNKDIITIGFESARIVEVVTKKLQNEDPFTVLELDIKLETQVVLLLKIRGKKSNLNVLSLYLIFCNLRLNLMKSPLEKNFVAECVAIVS